MDYPDWTKVHPPPDLAALVARHGGYSSIPPAAWAAYDAAMKSWLLAYRWRHQDEKINRYRDRRGRLWGKK